ncbi:hypothetical protein OG21DRAFT_1505085 [Imleria badia]|nr:hypothetical protein OG21DRAFT_1505085 [Imleria badia]
MDMDSDNDAGFQVLGRRHASPSSSRESSPVAQKRQRRSFTPTSDDGDLVVPVAPSEDTETPTPENAPLIRQAVGFSWTPSTSANVTTYQATVAPKPAPPYFLPGQAPRPPPKPKSSRPRAPRKKKDQQYSSQTTKFKLIGSTSSPPSGSTSLAATSPATLADTSASSPSMIPSTNFVFGYANGNATVGASNINDATTSVASDALRTRTSSKRKAPVSIIEPSARPPRPPAPISTSVTPHYPLNFNPGGPPVERPQVPAFQGTYSYSSASPPVRSRGTSVDPSNASRASTQSPISRPLRMLTLLIEDVRSSVLDSQLAEVKVPLKVADDPNDGFWADAAEVCNALQNGPSRIDGPAKVYTMRGRFRQFFMRVDQLDQLEVQSAHLGVSKERTLNVFVEAPVPQGQLPRPLVSTTDVQAGCNSSSECNPIASHTETCCRPTFSLVTREDQMERLSKSSYVRAQSGRFSPVSESGSYGHSQRPTSPQRPSRHDQYAGPSRRLLTPPIPGRHADTQEEKDEAIANYIRSHIENHTGWMEYMQSKANPQRVSEVLKQYAFVEDQIRELIGRKTPPHWDGAPNSYVERYHIWRVLKLDRKWGEECEETLLLVAFYGKNGSRYEDARVVDMINDMSPPRANTMDKFLLFLRSVDESFTRDALRGQFVPMPTQG